MRFVLETAVGVGSIAAVPMLAWMLFLGFVSVSQVWLLTGTALALIFSLATLAAAVMNDLRA